MDVFENDEVHQMCVETIFRIAPISIREILSETGKDEEIQELAKDHEHYFSNEGVLFRGGRIVIPQSLRAAIFEELHETDPGATKMKQLARKFCFWPKID